MIRIVLLLLGLIYPIQAIAQLGTLPYSGAPAFTFTSAWQPMLLGDGGNAQGVHVTPSGNVLSHVDTYNGYIHRPGVSCIIGVKILTAPCHLPLIVSSGVASPSGYSSDTFNNGVGDIQQHPIATNVFMALTANFIYISLDGAVTWAKTSRSVTFGTNAGPIQSQWLASDPNDATGNTWIINTPSQGAFRTTNALLGASATFTAISGISASTNNPGGGSVFFDLATSGGSQKIWITSDGIGVYECNSTTSSCSLLNSAGMPTRTSILTGDKFGQMWVGPGFYTSTFDVKVYASGAWSTKTLSNGNPRSNQFIIGLQFDPNTGSLVANNRVIAVYGFGDMCASLNNGTSCTNVLANSPPVASGNQISWLGSAVQSTSGIQQLNLNGSANDALGDIWVAGGISLYTTPNPIIAGVVQSTATFTVNSLGIEQLVTTQLLEAPGNGIVTTVWDRGIIYNPYADSSATVQFPQATTQILSDGFSVDYALANGSTQASLLVTPLKGHNGAALSISGSSTDGGITWSAWPSLPTGYGAGATIAVNTTLNWCMVPGNSGGAQNTVYCTPDGAANWYLMTGFTGTPQFVPNNNRADSTGHIAIVALKGSIGTFYMYDMANGRIYRSTNGNTTSPTATLVSTPSISINNAGKIKFLLVPGSTTDAFIVGYPTGSFNLWKSTNINSSGTFSIPAGASFLGLQNITGYGFGAPKPGTSTPMLYIVANTSGNSNYVIYASADLGTTISALNVPVTQQSWPSGNMDYPAWIAASPNYYGRVFYTVQGSGVPGYIDTSDACPYVKFSNVVMNASLSGSSVSITATHDGLVPVSGVNFYVSDLNGSNLVQIGTTQTGQTTYTVSLNATANAGSKLLRVSAIGNGCTSYNQNYNTFATPVTLS